jgi:outer membrane immunogenic protein
MISKKICAGATFVAMLIFSSNVQAADMPNAMPRAPEYSPPPPAYVVPFFTWTGFYAGLNAGYGWGKSTFSGNGPDISTSPAGFVGGGTIGYNLQTSAFVWGIEGDIDWTNLEDSQTSIFCGGKCNIKSTWLSTLRGRIGYGADRWLPYITGGLAYGSMNVGTNTGSETNSKAGWTVGAGLEYAFAGGWSSKLEYLYVDLGSTSCRNAVCTLPLDETATFKASVLRAGVNYRF